MRFINDWAMLILSICFIPTSGFALDYYFPEGSLSERKDLDDFIQEWYGKNLKALEEPALYLKRPGRNLPVPMAKNIS